MKPFRNSILAASLIAFCFLAVPAMATGNESVSYIRFDWSAPGIPGTVILPLPADLEISEIDAVSVPGEGHPPGFALEANPATLQLDLLPAMGATLAFSAVDLRLESNRQRRYEFGRAAVLALSGKTGPLSFERALEVTAAGLYQAVVLRNSGERDLLITSSRYLPPGIAEGRLLVAKGEPVKLLSRLEAEMSPAALREAQRDGSSYPQLEGFSWRPATDLDLRLAPRESVVLAWTDGSLPPPEAAMSFDLRPVIEYRLVAGVADAAAKRQLGLPVSVRRTQW